MSNAYQHPLHQHPSKPSLQGPVQTNSLAVVGFVISLVGLFVCGVPSIIGLIISVIALNKEPRGFAVAGTIIGILGLLLAIATCVVFYASYQAAVGIGNHMGGLISEVQATHMAGELGRNWKDNGELPSQATADSMLQGQTDMFGNEYVYESDGTSFSIRSAGQDLKLNTDDDVVVGPFSDAQSAIDKAGEYDQQEFDFEAEGLPFDESALDLDALESEGGF